LCPPLFPMLNPESRPGQRGNQGKEMSIAVTEGPPFDAASGAFSDAEKGSDFALDDSLPRSLREGLVRRNDEHERPRGKGCQEGMVTPEKRSEVHQGPGCRRVDEHGPVRRFDADRQDIGKQLGGRRSAGSGSPLRQALGSDSEADREMLDLVLVTGEPGHVRRLQHGVWGGSANVAAAWEWLRAAGTKGSPITSLSQILGKDDADGYPCK
jgi:hypothetical protein